MSEKARRWKLYEEDESPPFIVAEGPELSISEEEVEVAEVSALRKEWEEELLSDEAVNAAWDVIGPALPAGYVVEAFRAALKTVNKESDRD